MGSYIDPEIKYLLDVDQENQARLRAKQGLPFSVKAQNFGKELRDFLRGENLPVEEKLTPEQKQEADAAALRHGLRNALGMEPPAPEPYREIVTPTSSDIPITMQRKPTEEELLAASIANNQPATQPSINEQNAASADPAQDGNPLTPNGSGNGSGPLDYMQITPDIIAAQKDPTYLKALADERAAAQAGINQQKLSATDAQRLLEQYANKPTSVDLSPLLAYADAWTGHNISKGYTAPPTAEQKMTRIAELQDALRKAQTGVTDKQLQMLSGMRAQREKELDQILRGKIADKQAKEKSRDDANGGLNPNQVRQAKETFNREYGKGMDGMGQVANSLERMRAAVQRTGTIPLPGQDTEFDSAVGSLITAYNRDVAKLGALAGGDLNILNTTVAAGGSLTSDLVRRALGDRTPEKFLSLMKDELDRLDTRIEQTKDYAVVAPVVQEWEKGKKRYEQFRKMGTGKSSSNSLEQPEGLVAH